MKDSLHRLRALRPALLWTVLIGIIIVVVGGLALSQQKSATVNSVTADDLVEEYIGTTVYERPKQWPSVGTGSTSAFGEKGSSGKTTALVSASLGAYIDTAVDASDELLTKLRSDLLSELSEATISSESNNSPCTTVNEFKKEIDTTRTDFTAGIVRAEALCSKQDVSYRLKLRVVLGNDGYTRTILLVATDELWGESQAAFDTILESIRQVEPSESTDRASQPSQT